MTEDHQDEREKDGDSQAVERFIENTLASGGYDLSVLPTPANARDLAELQLIGAMILWPEIIPDVAARIKDAAIFKHAASKQMYRALCALDREGMPVARGTIRATFETLYPKANVAALLQDYYTLTETDTASRETYPGYIRILKAAATVERYQERAPRAKTPKQILQLSEDTVEKIKELDEHKPKPVDLADVAANGIPPVPWLVRGWLTEDDLAILAGGAYSGKSTLAYALAQSLSTGRPWLDMTPEKTVRVAVLDEEQGERSASRLMLRLGGPNENLRLYCGQGFNVGTAEGVRLLEHVLEDFKPGLVVFDSMSHLLAGVEDENDAMAMARAFRELHRIRQKYQLAILAIDHRPKWGRGGVPTPGELLDLTLRGSTVKATQASAVFSMVRNGDTAELRACKRRESDRLQSIRVGYKPDGDDGPIELENLGDVDELQGATDDAAQFIRAYLDERGATELRQILDAATAEGHKKRAVERALTVHSKPGGVLERLKRGVYRLAIGGNLAVSGGNSSLFSKETGDE